MRIIRRACIRGTARCSQLRVLDGWIYLKLELLRYSSISRIMPFFTIDLLESGADHIFFFEISLIIDSW